ncbi:MAG: hypothetical protein WD578_05200 [Bacteroidales bacterium]
MEGHLIKYQVNYLEDMAGDIPTKLLPDVMEAYYTNRYVMTRIHGFFGQFTLSQLADLSHNSVTTLLNFFGNKIYCTGEKGELPAGISEIREYSVLITNDTLRIGGFLSRKAVITSGEVAYDIFFIEDIDIKNPNITTPYYFIDYVLSDFRVQLSILKMRLIMVQHEYTSFKSSYFEIPEDYKQVSKETMETIINNLFTKE